MTTNNLVSFDMLTRAEYGPEFIKTQVPISCIQEEEQTSVDLDEKLLAKRS